MNEKIKEALKKEYTSEDVKNFFRNILNKIGYYGFMSIPFFIPVIWLFLILGAVINNFCNNWRPAFRDIYMGFMNSYYNTFTENACKWMLFLLVLFALVCVYFKRFNLKRMLKDIVTNRKWEIVFGILLAWTVICAVLSEDHGHAFYGTAVGNDGIISYFMYACAYFSATLCFREKQRNIYLKFFAWAAALIGFIVIFQELGDDLMMFIYKVDKAAVFYNSNPCGYFLNMGVLCAAGLLLFEKRLSRRILYGLVTAFNIYSLIINGTRGSLLGTIIGIIFITVLYFVYNKKISLRGFMAVIIFILVVTVVRSRIIPMGNPDMVISKLSSVFGEVQMVVEDPDGADTAGSYRFGIWKESIRLIAKKPIFGYGPEQMPELSDETLDYFANGRPHNEYIQHAMFWGIPGLMLYLIALVLLAVNKFKNLKNLKPSELICGGCIVAYLVSAFFGNTFSYTVIYFYIFLGLLSPRGRIRENRNEE